MSVTSEKEEFVVVGAGIIGICAAAYLAEAGHKVLVLDRTGICEETSSGNAGAFAFSDILPMASKGVIGKVPGWLMDPLGPFTIRPSYFPKLVPWLYRFWRASRSDMLEGTARAQVAMMRLAEPEMLALMARAGSSGMVREDGSLELYESEKELKAGLPGWSVREQAGIEFRHLRGAELADCQPGLSGRFVAGTFVPGWKTVSDPKLVGKAIWAYAESKGARFRQATVTGIAHSNDGATLRFGDGGSIAGRKIILAAGAWSHRLARQLGDIIPLETERGYNTTLPVGAIDLKRQLIFSGHGFVVTPMETGVRVGGAVELGGLELPPNYARSEAMLKKAKLFLPDLDTSGERQWMGYRPSLPDSLPVIGHAKSGPNIVYAFGHGHLGLTQAAATGRLVRNLALGENSPLDLAPFSPQRF
ncbi:MAG: NAD(P)/FAD-dependent oxidoreductase [Phyllobacterium sp.]